MMDAVKNGGNRQELHEKIRQLSMEAGKTVKEEGKDNNLVYLIAADPSFGLTKEQIEGTLQPEQYVGRAPYQVTVYLRDVVQPVLDANKDELGVRAEINV
jgi:adenylosuccinate lyase